MTDPRLHLFNSPPKDSLTPDLLNDPFGFEIPEIAQLAVKEFQVFLLENDTTWTHNFGIDSNKGASIKGKMVGVLVVKTMQNELGYLCTFSGKLTDKNLPAHFVPSVFDESSDNYFINRGMAELTNLGAQIKALEFSGDQAASDAIHQLKELRKIKSASLQQQLFENYAFLNQSGESKTIVEIFAQFSLRKPPSAAGECAAPKLLNYAFKNQMKPIAIAEFWWGKSPESEQRIHQSFYPACEDKCRPILTYMLENF